MTYSALEKKIHSLPEDCINEVSNYIEYVLLRVNRKSKDEKHDLNEYFGSVKGLADGLQLQRSFRDEWS